VCLESAGFKILRGSLGKIVYFDRVLRADGNTDEDTDDSEAEGGGV
jgi:hypothetical protein